MGTLDFNNFLNNENIDKKGIYFIICDRYSKIYVGSTSESFRKRFTHHKTSLKNKKHKNSYLQNIFNKYGENSFKFKIVEILDENILDREQFYIDSIVDKININPIASGTPNLSLETIKKRAQTVKKFMRDAVNYFKLYEKGDIAWLMRNNFSAT